MTPALHLRVDRVADDLAQVIDRLGDFGEYLATVEAAWEYHHRTLSLQVTELAERVTALESAEAMDHHAVSRRVSELAARLSELEARP